MTSALSHRCTLDKLICIKIYFVGNYLLTRSSTKMSTLCISKKNRLRRGKFNNTPGFPKSMLVVSANHSFVIVADFEFTMKTFLALENDENN